MDKKTASSFFLLGFLLCTRSLAQSGEPTAACKAAASTENYVPAVPVPADVKALVASYREGWKNFCSDAKNRPTLATLYGQAKQIEKKFYTVLDEAIQPSGPGAAQLDNVEVWVSKGAPQFIPAFMGSVMEQQFFMPDNKEFIENAPRGTAEDQLFFASSVGRRELFPDWIEQTWDSGGCTRYGQFNWVNALKDLVQLKKDLKSPAYIESLRFHEAQLIGRDNYDFSPNGSVICSCQEKEAVLKDFTAIDEFLKKEQILKSYQATIEIRINDIKTGKVIVNSEAEQHCSGG